MQIIFRSLIFIFISVIFAITAVTAFGATIGGGVIAVTSTDLRNRVNDVLLFDVRTGLPLSMTDDIAEGDITGRTPIWSSDGESLSFWTFHNRQDTFAYEVNLNEHIKRNLTVDQPFLSLPIYGANRQMLFASFPTFNNVDLYLVNEDIPDGEIILEAIQGIPAWSNDGRYIAYIAQYVPPPSEDDTTIDNGNGNFPFDIFIFDTISAETTNLTESLNNIGVPIWSPDGSEIIFILTQSNFGQIYRIDIASGEVQETPLQTRILDRPIWSPDGRYLAFTSNQGNRDGNFNAEIVILDMETYELTNISNSPFYDNNPTWSPDSNHIAFLSRRTGGQSEVFVTNIHSDSIRRLTYTSTDEADLSWRPR